MNEPSTQKTTWCYHRSVTYVTFSGEVLMRTFYLSLRKLCHRATIMRANGNFSVQA